MAPNGKKILVVEDEEGIRVFLTTRLGRAGYEVVEAVNGLEGLQKFYSDRPDIVILDIAMPEMDGWQTLQRIREVSTVPIVMLTAATQEREKIRGLDEGADDYITKPFSGDELLARVSTVLRRTDQPVKELENNVYRDAELSIDFQRHEVFVRGEPVVFSATEFRLLSALTSNEGNVLSQERLLDLVWGQDYDDSLNIVRLYINYLRRKIEVEPSKPKLIETVRGFGYRYRGAKTTPTN